MHIKVVTWNVHGCVGTDGIYDSSRIAAVLNVLEPDIVGLQEVTNDQLEQLALESGLEAVPGPARYEGEGSFGNALLTRFSVRGVSRSDLSVQGREPRALLDAQLDVASKTVRVMVTHFGLRVAERRRQVEALLRVIRRDEATPIVILGDFNEWRPRAWMLARLRSELGKAPAVASFPSRCPVAALDRVWVVPGNALVEISSIKSSQARIASDHLPVQATIEVERL